MTEERLPLNELLQKAGDGDFLRAVAESVLQLLMEADVEGLIGAGRHERAADRLNWRRYHVVPSGPSAVKLGGEHGTYASANSRGCRTGSFGGDRAQQDDLASRRLRSVYKQGISSQSGWR